MASTVHQPRGQSPPCRAFDTRLYSDGEWSDGFVHARLQDVVVDPARQQSGIGVRMVARATEASRAAGCAVQGEQAIGSVALRRCR